MTVTLMDHHAATRASTSPAERLRISTAAVRVSLRWLGVRKTLTPEQKNQAAEPFHAEGQFLSARKKLLDTSHPVYKEVTAVRGRVQSYWKGCTLPYPEPGIRLIKQDQIEQFNQQMEEFRGQLDEAVTTLDRHYEELRVAARSRLGQLYDPADYPPRLTGLFGIDWEFPSVEPPDYLLQLSPAIYEQERNRVTARFQEAVQLAEQALPPPNPANRAHLAVTVLFHIGNGTSAKFGPHPRQMYTTCHSPNPSITCDLLLIDSSAICHDGGKTRDSRRSRLTVGESTPDRCSPSTDTPSKTPILRGSVQGAPVPSRS